MKIASLVSGGVDSSVTIPLIKEMGYDPHLFYIEIGMKDDPNWIDCPAEEDIEIVTYIAKKYGCKMEIVSLQEDYWEKVISYTINAVKQGLTPNPDIMCNKLIKFGAFNEKYGNSFDLITTGHYATILTIDHEKYLGTAKDTFKDQTYFLGQITKKQLDKLMFPIGHLLKEEVRQKEEKLIIPISLSVMLAKSQVKLLNWKQKKSLEPIKGCGFIPLANAKDWDLVKDRGLL